MSVWIGAPYNNASMYNLFQNSMSLDGYYRLTGNVSTGQCTVLNCDPIEGSIAVIRDNTSCNSTLAYFCESSNNTIVKVFLLQ